MTRLRLLLLLTVTAATLSAGVPAHARDGRYKDPFEYCKAVGTVDEPDGRWAGARVPAEVVEGLVKAAEIPAGAPRAPLARMTHWRCMEGEVYACFVGANIPCTAKADTSRTPSPGMWAFCRENPDADPIPAYVTGRETVFAWRCTGGVPTIVRQVTEPDARGFLRNVWYRIPAES